MRNLIIILICLLAVGRGLMAVGTILSSSQQVTPLPFPLDDPAGSYTIAHSPFGYTVVYRNGKGFVGEVFVGTSATNLDSYVDQPVRVVGRYREEPSSTQCIARSCRAIFADAEQRALVVDLDAVEVLAD